MHARKTAPVLIAAAMLMLQACTAQAPDPADPVVPSPGQVTTPEQTPRTQRPHQSATPPTRSAPAPSDDHHSGTAVPTEISQPWPGCSIQREDVITDAEPIDVVETTLHLTCRGTTTTIEGDFSSGTYNNYDVDQQGIRSVIVVDGQVRIFHAKVDDDGTTQGCITIQSPDDARPSMDECDTARYDGWTKDS